MNPLLITSSLKGFFSSKIGKGVMIAIIVIIIALLLKKTIKKGVRAIQENRFNKDETKEINQLALQYRTASNPSGNNWMIDFDGTNNDAVERLAYQTKGKFEEVADAYKLKYDETLSDRMNKELNSDELQNWRNIVE